MQRVTVRTLFGSYLSRGRVLSSRVRADWLLAVKNVYCRRAFALAQVAELADAPHSKCGSSECGFESHLGHHKTPRQSDINPLPLIGEGFLTWLR